MTSNTIMNGTIEAPLVSPLQNGAKSPAATESTASKRDEFIMDTNNSSIVSKRSVEKLYYSGEPEYFRYFVTKFKRRSPLINRGYWLRMKAIEHTVARFLAETTTKQKLVVNLGCGSDPLPFMFLGKQPDLCQGARFIDVDYPDLMQHKIAVIQDAHPLRSLLKNYAVTGLKSGLVATSNPYLAIGCDMNSIDQMSEALAEHLFLPGVAVAVLFVAEVSVAYMERSASQAVLQWASMLDDVRFCLLEQHLPDGPEHPFAQTMLAHFNKLRTPLHAIGTMEHMNQRFLDAGWPEKGIDLRTLWELWSDPTFLTAEQRRSLDKVEPFDEWEEFGLFASHYFLMVAERKSDQDYAHRAHRTSMFGLEGKSPVSSPPSSTTHSPKLSKTANESTDDSMHATPLIGPSVARRYAAPIPPVCRQNDGQAVGTLGGMGVRERRIDCDTYCSVEGVRRLNGPPLRTGLQCHTATRIGDSFDCLLVGGRTSPDKAVAECWMRKDGTWRRARDLPEGRFRHCAVAMKLQLASGVVEGVLVFGGKTSGGNVLDQWLLWADDGWSALDIVGDTPPGRFGASMITDVQAGTSGVLVGGMTNAGRILSDLWHWSLEPDMTLRCRNMAARALGVLKHNAGVLGRFGAEMVRSSQGILMIGGIGGGRMLTKADEVLNMKTLKPQPLSGPRVLLVGCNIWNLEDGLLILGGGATCFSFGTYWNQPCLLTSRNEGISQVPWRLMSPSDELAGHKTEEVPGEPARLGGNVEPQKARARPSLLGPEPTSISRTAITTVNRFEDVVIAGLPVVFTRCDIGACTNAWTPAYLRDAIGPERKVVVHSSPSSTMDFQGKNFDYITTSFGHFVNSIARGEKMYLRSLSREAPSDRPTNLADDYPEIAADFEIPGELSYCVERLHSSPLRISGPVRMWLHYDVMANVLCQVQGRKRLLLYPPSDVNQLDFPPGASSSALDVFNTSVCVQKRLTGTHPREALLEPGDILFIPPMWIHTAEPTDGMSVAINIFFRSLGETSYAAGRDVYGNRDLAAYERGRKDVSRIVKSFQELPRDVSGFYLERLGQELLDEARRLHS